MRKYMALAVVMAIASAAALHAGGQTEPSHPIVGSVFMHATAAGETFASLGSRFGVAPSTLARLNHRSTATPLRAGELILIDNRHIRPPGDATLVVNVAQRMLFHNEKDTVRAYPIAVGAEESQTPLGSFTVTGVLEHPGTADRSRPIPFIHLSAGIGIEAANEPNTVYQLSTKGNIRMHRSDLIDLHSRVRIGTAGVLVYEPLLATTVSGRVFVEVHADQYALSHAPMGRLATLIFARCALDQVNWPLVQEAFTRKDGIAVDVTKIVWD